MGALKSTLPQHGYHQPVMLNECLEALNINPGGVYIDVTFGGGGHSRKILERLNDKGRLIAFDQDQDARQNVPDDKRFILVEHNFRFMQNFLKYLNAIPADGILADLGVSSHQFDKGERGFSYRFESELDMRMDKQQNLTASEVIRSYNELQLIDIFKKYGEVNNARKLASSIIRAREMNPVTTIDQFRKAIESCTPKKEEYSYLSQVFQAIRIEVNDEMGALNSFLLQTGKVLKSNGRLVIMSYHSLEDRPVKNYINKGNIEGIEKKNIYGHSEKPFRAFGKVIKANVEETMNNPRARSAKLRIAEKN